MYAFHKILGMDNGDFEIAGSNMARVAGKVLELRLELGKI